MEFKFFPITGCPCGQRDPLCLRVPAPGAEAGDGAAHGHERHPTLLATGKRYANQLLFRIKSNETTFGRISVRAPLQHDAHPRRGGRHTPHPVGLHTHRRPLQGGPNEMYRMSAFMV